MTKYYLQSKKESRLKLYTTNQISGKQFHVVRKLSELVELKVLRKKMYIVLPWEIINIILEFYTIEEYCKENHINWKTKLF